MGLTRKLLSLSTAGAVDFRSDKERIARYTKRTAKAVEEQARQQPPGPAVTPPGWYQHPADRAGVLRWWDGYSWTGAVR